MKAFWLCLEAVSRWIQNSQCLLKSLWNLTMLLRSVSYLASLLVVGFKELYHCDLYSPSGICFHGSLSIVPFLVLWTSLGDWPAAGLHPSVYLHETTLLRSFPPSTLSVKYWSSLCSQWLRLCQGLLYRRSGFPRDAPEPTSGWRICSLIWHSFKEIKTWQMYFDPSFPWWHSE